MSFLLLVINLDTPLMKLISCLGQAIFFAYLPNGQVDSSASASEHAQRLTKQ